MESWKKLRSLGQGNFGEVSLASPATTSGENTSSVIAVKSVMVHDWASVDALEEEAAFLKHLIGEPYVIRAFGEDKTEETYHLILEYASGGHLDDLIMTSPKIFDPAQVADFTRMLLTGLSKIHEHGIVHCDLKPKNILVFPRNGEQIELKIADFGLGLWVSDQRKYGHRGSTLYSSPESLSEGRHGTCTDIWSLGIVVAEMMNPGMSFFDQEDENMSLYDQIVHETIDLEERVPSDYNEYAHDFLEKCLDPNPENRWSAEELLKHPFITENLKGESGCSFDQIKAENPINGSSEWVYSSNLFLADEDDEDIQHLFTDEEGLEATDMA